MKATPILDLLIYIKSYAPHFPEEDQTSVEHEFQKLRERLGSFGRKPMSSEARLWFDIAVRDVEDAAHAYELNENAEGERALDSAEDHLRRAIAGKSRKSRFVVSPEGDIDEK